MSFDYTWTCPEIDSNIYSFKENLYDNIIQIITDTLDEHGVEEYDMDNVRDEAKSWCDHIYSNSEDIFENVRSCNEDIRKAAESQIYELKNQVENLEYQLGEYDD